MSKEYVYKISLKNGWEGILEPGKAQISITINDKKYTGVLSEYNFKLKNKQGQDLAFSVYKTSKGEWYNPLFEMPQFEIPSEIIESAKQKVDEINSHLTIKI